MPSAFNVQPFPLLQAILLNETSAYSKTTAFSLMSLMLSTPLPPHSLCKGLRVRFNSY